jgi:uncharacterized protein with PIN domain
LCESSRPLNAGPSKGALQFHQGIRQEEKNPPSADKSIRQRWAKPGGTEEVKFLADSMLGKLAKWLRILGYDTAYRSHYRPGFLDLIIKEDRHLLSRHKETADQYAGALLIHADRVGEQLNELKQLIPLAPDRSNWFSRCLICNVVLREAEVDEARENVPEYVFYQNTKEIRFCPSCGRYYWPGSHRKRMISQLEEWGFTL